MSINRLHYLGGTVLAGFVIVHLSNHIVSFVGIKAHIEAMEILRKVYRQPLVETMLLLIVASQIFSGIKLFVSRRKQARIFFEKLHIFSGLYLGVFFIIHLLAIIVGRYIQKLDTNFYFGVAGLNTFPFLLFFVPYYGLALLSFFGHIASIHRKKMRRSVLSLSPNRQSKGIMFLGIFLTILIFYGLTNHFNAVQIPTGYNILIGK